MFLLTEPCIASCWYYLALFLVSRKQGNKTCLGPYISATLENDWFMARPFAISKCTYCLGRLISVRSKKIIKPSAPKLFKKPFAVQIKLVTLSCPLSEMWPYIHVRARKPIQCIKIQARIFNEHGAFNLQKISRRLEELLVQKTNKVSRFSAFIHGYLLNCALDFD